MSVTYSLYYVYPGEPQDKEYNPDAAMLDDLRKLDPDMPFDYSGFAWVQDHRGWVGDDEVLKKLSTMYDCVFSLYLQDDENDADGVTHYYKGKMRWQEAVKTYVPYHDAFDNMFEELKSSR